MAVRTLTAEEISDIAAKIENEGGIDYYFNEGGWGQTDFKGTAVEPVMWTYIEARRELMAVLEKIGALDA